MRKLTAFIALLIALATIFAMSACTDEGSESSSAADSSVAENLSSEEESLVSAESTETSAESIVIESSDASAESSGTAETAEVRPLLYKATGKNGGTVYLLGTIHVGDERVETLPDYVMDAYNESDWLCVEADIVKHSSDTEAQMALAQRMLCDVQKGETVKNYISEELYGDMKKLLEDKELYNQLYDYYKPVFWYTLLQEVYLADTGLSSDYGVDNTLLNLAHDGKKEIREAEGIDYQYDMLFGFDNEIYRMMIESVVYDYQASVDGTTELYELWLSGNEAEFAKALAEEDELEDLTDEELALYEDYNKAMITDRNLAMTKLVEEYLAEDGTGFFAVGAAHIVGEGAAVELLRAEGYTVELVSAD